MAMTRYHAKCCPTPIPTGKFLRQVIPFPQVKLIVHVSIDTPTGTLPFPRVLSIIRKIKQSAEIKAV